MFSLVHKCVLMKQRLWSPLFFIGDYSNYRGFSSDLASYMLAIVNGMSMVGRLVLFIADKVGRSVQGIIVTMLGINTSFYRRFNILIISLTICGVLELAMWTVISNHGSIFAFTILYGFFTGSHDNSHGAMNTYLPIQAG